MRYVDTVLRTSLFSIGLIMSLVVGEGRADPPEKYTFLAYDDGIRQARHEGKKIFLYYGRHGCGFCEKTNKETFSDAEIYRLFTENYVLVYVDAEGTRRLTLPTGERITELQFGARMKALVTPIFMYLEPDGRKILSIPGFQTVNEFKDYDRYVRGGHYQKTSLAQFLGQMQ